MAISKRFGFFGLSVVLFSLSACGDSPGESGAGNAGNGGNGGNGGSGAAAGSAGSGATSVVPEPDPEAVCAAWTESSCKTLAGCCGAGNTFDDFDCARELSGNCLDGIDAEQIHAGAGVFDQKAAEECYKPLSGCDSPVVNPAAQPEACHNVLTGYRPLGAGCAKDSECLRPDEGYATCYEGIDGFGDGVCAKVVPSSSGKCSFTKQTFVLTTCAGETYCDNAAAAAGMGPPSDHEYAFEAECKPLVAAGQPCAVKKDGGGITQLPCAKGLYCESAGVVPEERKCAPQKKVGESCKGSPQNECVAGSDCDFATDKCKAVGGLTAFCFAPPACGNGDCEAGETAASCAADCGVCGDGVCGPDEMNGCLKDCGTCGDGVCYLDEDSDSCPQDCGICGDKICDPGEALSCPQDCAECGDGFCDPGEMGVCDQDCGSSCVTCGEYLTRGMGQLCQGSDNLYADFIGCACAGSCKMACGDSFCIGDPSSATCDQCLQDGATGCGDEFNACANDL